MEVLEVKRVRHYKYYDIRDEVWDGQIPKMKPQLMTGLAYSKTGDWIGLSKDAYRLVQRFGIQKFEKRSADSCVCSLGYAPETQKWYGWSHRAISGFGIGDVVKEGDCVASSGWTEEWLAEHPEDDESLPVGFVVKTVEDAKTMAIAFAESVS